MTLGIGNVLDIVPRMTLAREMVADNEQRWHSLGHFRTIRPQVEPVEHGTLGELPDEAGAVRIRRMVGASPQHRVLYKLRELVKLLMVTLLAELRNNIRVQVREAPLPAGDAKDVAPDGKGRLVPAYPGVSYPSSGRDLMGFVGSPEQLGYDADIS
jgi:hypothetical protein